MNNKFRSNILKNGYYFAFNKEMDKPTDKLSYSATFYIGSKELKGFTNFFSPFEIIHCSNESSKFRALFSKLRIMKKEFFVPIGEQFIFKNFS